MTALVKDAKRSIERAREFLMRHHANTQWAEVMRDLKCTLEECVRELEKKTP